MSELQVHRQVAFALMQLLSALVVFAHLYTLSVTFQVIYGQFKRYHYLVTTT